ncbi:hypothetical protein M0G43_02175 [Subsaxibacter sp. CAU 1640]|uniref:hypothetical protein n=1 Tax=Subsaxibacter sp. CAU 1640 TaxID=2933271 RepID=UPI002004B4D1|nr:hypothetical protein [Subsaxibacter sp. CAU 1640]MCK7589372.1 hypothetical protein [Subsaxibacter sp. CAU 1640]
MSKSQSTSAPLKLYCSLFGHQYEVSKKVTRHVKEYTCKCCKRQLTTNGNGNLIELTPKFREINAVLEDIYMRRKMRLQQKTFTSSIYLSNAVGY